jgi:hypothetical protein
MPPLAAERDQLLPATLGDPLGKRPELRQEFSADTHKQKQTADVAV